MGSAQRTDFAAMLHTARPWIADVLIDADAWQKIWALADPLPPVWEMADIECRLGKDQHQVDVLLCAAVLNRGRAQMSRALGSTRDCAPLEPLRPLLERWASDDAFASGVPILWLEFDLPSDQPSERGGLVGIGLNRNHFTPGRHPRSTPLELRARSSEALALVDAQDPEPAALATIAHCADALPASGCVNYVAKLSGRGSKHLRLHADLPLDELDGWLERLGWRDSGGRLEAVHSALASDADHWDRVGVQIEITPDGLGAYLGVEIYPEEEWQRPLLGRLLSALVARGSSDPEKARAVLDWSGLDRIKGRDGWPMQLERTTIVKLIPDGAGGLEAKAYLGIRQHHALL